uniref:Ubiquitin-like protease family profile domain-containing protein n=1 Tax=Trieres chinensis TaxID=1514140 RepID=A0A7S2AA63_TRICV|mmetsp:Transcript_9175/g.19467  ORF Transcript_9175/g.19467 Transcript_9175/m.19467 type:complete len:252 (+) Transcript_9175:1-756(+)
MDMEKRRPVTSSVYFFTSHFFSTLQEDGPEAVTSWTAKKNIDIFQKKLIFLPINESLHWSLCVVVNPGSIMNSISCGRGQRFEQWPCILFFDSLKAHRKSKVASKVRGWLNSEAMRLGKFGSEDKPFSVSSMKVYDPKIPYQDNSWDCGVFVCRYAYSLFLLREENFNRYDAESDKRPFEELITNNIEFEFDMGDISRLRREMQKLIKNLSDSYLKLKEKEAERKRERKLRKKQSKEWVESSKKGNKAEMV